MSEEWCLHLQLDGDADGVESVLGRIVEEVAPPGRLTRQGPVVRIYSSSEAEAASTEVLVIGLVEETPLGYELWQERWNDESGEWEELAPEGEGMEPAPPEAAAPVGEPEERRGVDLASLPRADWRERGCWLVKVELADAEEASLFLEQLRAHGAEATRSGHRVGALVPDSGTAAWLAAELEKLVPEGATVTSAQASRVERLAYGVSS